MDLRNLIAIAALAITMATGFWKVASALGRIELKLELLWEAYVRTQAPTLHRRSAAHDRRRKASSVIIAPD